MTRIPLALLAATLLAGTAAAQGTAAAPGATSNAPMSGVNPNVGVAPGTGPAGRNQAVATTDANAPRPARGRSSFTQAQARRRLERNGYQEVSGLNKDRNGVWRGTATKDGQPVQVWLDYKGNAGQQNAGASSVSATGTYPAGSAAGRSGAIQ